MPRTPNKTKLTAFTLFEVLVTLALSALVVLFSFSAYQMLGGYFHQWSRVSSVHAERMGFCQVFARQVDRCDSIHHPEEEQLIIWLDAEAQTWQFGTEGVLLNDQTPFHTGPVVLTTQTLAGTPAAGSSLVHKMSLHWAENDADSVRFRFYKKYELRSFLR